MISFVVVSGGARPERVVRLVESLREQEGLPPAEFIVVGRHDGDLPDDARLLPAEKEAETAAICRMRNLGIGAAFGDPVVLLDDDMEFPPGWWEAMAPSVGRFDLTGCRVVTPAGNRWYDWAWASRTDPACPPRMIGYDEIVDGVYISGCFMMIARPVFAKLLFDEARMNHQKDDVDFCHRAVDAGFTIGIVPGATAIHHLDPAGRSAADPAAGPEAFSQGIHLFRLKRYDEALPLLEKGEDPDNPVPARYHRGLALSATGRRAEARPLLEGVVAAAHPAGADRRLHYSAHYHLGLIAEGEGRVDDARRHFGVARDGMPEHVQAARAVDRLA
jgi:tetratricopeptide (TPR) repeat protein